MARVKSAMALSYRFPAKNTFPLLRYAAAPGSGAGAGASFPAVSGGEAGASWQSNRFRQPAIIRVPPLPSSAALAAYVAAMAPGAADITLAYMDHPFGADQFYGNFNSWERTRIWFASLRQAFGKKTEASVAFRRHTDLFVLYRDRPQIFTNRHAVESWQGALRRREELSRTARLFFGAEGYRDAIASSNLGAHARVRAAGYVNLDVRALRRFSMSLGVRREVHGSFDGQTSPTLAAGVWLSSHVKLRSSLSHAFRLPSYTELYYHDPASQGSRDLRPERAGSYEAGLDWNGGGRFRGGVAVFHRRDTDGIDFIRRSSGEVWRAANIQRLRFTGLEVTAGAVLRRVHEIELRYAGLRGTGSVPVGMFSRYVFNYPSHSGIVSWRGALPAGLVEHPENFDLRPGAIIRDLGLRKPLYRKTAAYGHFGRDDIEFPWERTDKAEALKKAAGL